MFRGKSSGRRKHRWFFEVITTDDAHEAMALCYKTFYVLAAMQGIFIAVGVYFSESGYGDFFDPLMMVGCLVTPASIQ